VCLEICLGNEKVTGMLRMCMFISGEKMKENFFYEAYHYTLHVFKIFLGLGSNYHMPHHKPRKLIQRLNKNLISNYRSLDDTQSPDLTPKDKLPFPPNKIQ
jgi:hypothetical protein